MPFSTPSLHGAFRRSDLVAECGKHAVESAVGRGLLRPLWTGVLVEGARALDVRTRAAAALLTTGADAVVCGPTAAALHGSAAIPAVETHVVVPYGRGTRSRSGLVVHHAGFYGKQIVELDGLRVLSWPQVIADLCCTARPADVLALTDEALRLSMPRSEELRTEVRRRIRARLDPRGTVRGADLLELASARAESPPESWLRMLLVEREFPLAEVNFSVSSPAGRQLYRLDLAWPSLRIAVEYDGYAVHTGREEQDAAREDDLRRRGWIVVRATAADLSDPTRLLAELRAAFARRGYTW